MGPVMIDIWKTSPGHDAFPGSFWKAPFYELEIQAAADDLVARTERPSTNVEEFLRLLLADIAAQCGLDSSVVMNVTPLSDIWKN